MERLIAGAQKRVGARTPHRDATMILIAFRHGLRASELCSLRWDILDLSQGRYHVTRRKNGRPSVHLLRGTEIRALRRFRCVERQSVIPTTPDPRTLLMSDARAFRGFRFPAEVILWAVRWYLQFPISYRDLERMLAARGVAVDHTTMYRWVQRFAPELEKRTRRHLRPCRGPWHVDETYLQVDGEWRYLYRAVDGTGQTIDFLLSAKRDKQAAR